MRRKILIWRKSVIYGTLASLSLVALYLAVVSLFQGLDYAVSRYVELWYLMVPLVVGFGIQIGLFTYIRNFAETSAGTSGSCGGISAASMVACCAHHVTDAVPLIGVSAAGGFLLEYQPVFLVLGLISNVAGIAIMVKIAKKNRVKFHMDGSKLLHVTAAVVAVALLVFSLFFGYQRYYGEDYRRAVSSELSDECETPPEYTDDEWREHMIHHPDRYKECLGG